MPPRAAINPEAAWAKRTIISVLIPENFDAFILEPVANILLPIKENLNKIKIITKITSVSKKRFGIISKVHWPIIVKETGILVKGSPLVKPITIPV